MKNFYQNRADCSFRSISLLVLILFIGQPLMQAQEFRKVLHPENSIRHRGGANVSDKGITFRNLLSRPAFQQSNPILRTPTRLIAGCRSDYSTYAEDFMPSDSFRIYWNGQSYNPEIIGYFFSDEDLLYLNPVENVLEAFLSGLVQYPLEPARRAPVDSIVQFWWDNGESRIKTMLNFNEQGYITSLANLNSINENDSTFVEYYTYDPQMNLTTTRSFYKLTQDWLNSTKREYTYDNLGRLIRIFMHRWSTITDAWVEHSKDSLIYDSNGRLSVVESADDEAGTLVNSYKYILSYNSQGLIEEGQGMFWVTDSWQTYEAFNVQYNGQGKPLEIIYKKDKGEGLENEEKDVYTYNASGRTETITHSEWKVEGWKLEYDERFNYANDLLEEYVYSEWYRIGQGGNYVDVSDWMREVHFRYKTNNQVEAIEEFTQKDEESGLSHADDDIRLTYYYEEFEGDPAEINDIAGQMEIRVYPNPAQTSLTIQSDKIAFQHIRIADLSGKQVFETRTTFNTNTASLPVTQLPDGIYLVQLQCQGRWLSTKFTIQH